MNKESLIKKLKTDCENFQTLAHHSDVSGKKDMYNYFLGKISYIQDLVLHLNE